MTSDVGRTFLGLDIGTSALKAVVVDLDQRVLATASAAYPVSHPGPGRAEQSPALWWQALESVMGELRTALPEALGRVAGIGLSGQMHGLVLQDAKGESRKPAMLWNDGRAAAESRELNRRLPWLGERTGIGAMPSFWPAKLRWLQRHDPGALAEAQHLLLPKDQLRWQMGANGSPTCAMPPAPNCWTRPGVTGATTCWPPVASTASACRGWSRAVSRVRPSIRPWPRAGACPRACCSA